VDVDIDGKQATVNRNEFEVAHAGLLAGLAEGNLFDAALAIGVATQLQPAIKLAVVCEQRSAAVGGENPGGAGDVAGPAGALETIGVCFDEGRDAIRDGCLLRKDAPVMSEQFEDRTAVHNEWLVVSGESRVIARGWRAW
jgi:hypothetical protein